MVMLGSVLLRFTCHIGNNHFYFDRSLYFNFSDYSAFCSLNRWHDSGLCRSSCCHRHRVTELLSLAITLQAPRRFYSLWLNIGPSHVCAVWRTYMFVSTCHNDVQDCSWFWFSVQCGARVTCHKCHVHHMSQQTPESRVHTPDCVPHTRLCYVLADGVILYLRSNIGL